MVTADVFTINKREYGVKRLDEPGFLNCEGLEGIIISDFGARASA